MKIFFTYYYLKNNKFDFSKLIKDALNYYKIYFFYCKKIKKSFKFQLRQHPIPVSKNKTDQCTKFIA